MSSGLCATFKLNGGQSYGGGGRRLRFNWTVEWADPADPRIDANATADLRRINSGLALVNGQFQQRQEWQAPAVVVGPLYKFTLRVTNFLSVTSEKTSLVVQRENKQLPGLSLGSEKKTMKTALGTTLEGKHAVLHPGRWRGTGLSFYQLREIE